MGNNGHKLAIAGATTLIAEPVLALAHGGGVGVIVGLAAGAVAYWLTDEFQPTTAGEETSPPASSDKERPANKDKSPDEPSLLYRMLNGKSMRSESQEDEQDSEPETAETQRQVGPWVPPQFRLDDALDIVHAFNKKHCVYFGNSEEGAIAIPLADMYHVIDVSSSGKGKSNRFRLGMMQMVNHCETYYINPIASKVKAVKDDREIEVWQPIYDRLANKRPMKEGPEIQDLLNAMVEEIDIRNQMEEDGDFSWQERPIFVFIDELPEVFARCPDAIKMLDKIGRAGRNYYVFTWVASQTALTTEIGQSTAAQANYKTRIYGGGDTTSANRLMKGKVPAETEKLLQTSKAGLTLMLGDGMSGSSFVRAPLVTNEALFEYLGLPAFRKEDWIKSKPSAQPTRRMIPMTDPAFPTLTLLPKSQKEVNLSSETIEEKGKGKSGKRVKGPNEEAILDALDALQSENRPLTLNAVATRAGLTRHQYDDIEEITAYYGYDLARGSGRPAAKEAVR